MDSSRNSYGWHILMMSHDLKHLLFNGLYQIGDSFRLIVIEPKNSTCFYVLTCNYINNVSMNDFYKTQLREGESQFKLCLYTTTEEKQI